MSYRVYFHVFASIIAFLFTSSNLHGQRVEERIIESHRLMILFDSDIAIVKPMYSDSIQALIENIDISVLDRVEIHGHTDDVGSESYNMALSRRRCDAVNKIVNVVLSEDKTKVFPYGESLPEVNETTEDARKSNRRVRLSIFTIQRRLHLSGVVKNEEGEYVFNANIEIRSKDEIQKTTSDSVGGFTFDIPAGYDAYLAITAKKHFYISKKLDRKQQVESPVLEFSVPTIKNDSKFTLTNFLFHGNRAMLLNQSKPYVEYLRETMLINDDVCVEIAGHINRPDHPSVTRNSTNYKLSVARSISIRDSLVVAGVDSRRLLTRGYGNWQMLFPHATSKKQQQLNRRVELHVIPCATIKNIRPDTLLKEELRQYYYNLYQARPINTNLPIDLAHFSIDERKTILESLSKMRGSGIEPQKYTYKEILDGVPFENKTNQ